MSTLSVKNLKEYIEKVANKESENLIHSEELHLFLVACGELTFLDGLILQEFCVCFVRLRI